MATLAENGVNTVQTLWFQNERLSRTLWIENRIMLQEAEWLGSLANIFDVLILFCILQ